MNTLTTHKSADEFDLSARNAADISRLRVGDYVTVRTKVLAYEGPEADALPITIDPNPWAYEIVEHEPALEAETVEAATRRIANEMAGRIAAQTLERHARESASLTSAISPSGKRVNRETRKPITKDVV